MALPTMLRSSPAGEQRTIATYFAIQRVNKSSKQIYVALQTAESTISSPLLVQLLIHKHALGGSNAAKNIIANYVRPRERGYLDPK